MFRDVLNIYWIYSTSAHSTCRQWVIGFQIMFYLVESTRVCMKKRLLNIFFFSFSTRCVKMCFDLSVRWAHTWEGTFSHVAAQLLMSIQWWYCKYIILYWQTLTIKTCFTLARVLIFIIERYHAAFSSFTQRSVILVHRDTGHGRCFV